MLCVPAVAADSNEETALLATTSYQRILALFQGQPLWLKPPVETMDGLWSREEEAGVRGFLDLQVKGRRATVKSQLEKLLTTVKVDELMFTVDLYDPVSGATHWIFSPQLKRTDAQSGAPRWSQRSQALRGSVSATIGCCKLWSRNDNKLSMPS